MGISAAAVTDVRILRIVPSILLLAHCGYGILTVTQRTLAPNLRNATGEAEDNRHCGGHLTSYAGNFATASRAVPGAWQRVDWQQVPLPGHLRSYPFGTGAVHLKAL